MTREQMASFLFRLGIDTAALDRPPETHLERLPSPFDDVDPFGDHGKGIALLHTR